MPPNVNYPLENFRFYGDSEHRSLRSPAYAVAELLQAVTFYRFKSL